MNPVPADFAGIALNNYVSGPCSPILDEDFLGIRIRAPESVDADPDMILPVCGSYRFLAAFWNRFENLRYEMAIVAVDTATHIPYITNLQYRDYESMTRKFKTTDSGFDEKTAAGWFNADLTFYLADFPRTAATYHMFALLGEERSNIVTVKVVKP